MKKQLSIVALACLIFSFHFVNAQDELWYFGGWPAKGGGVYFNGGSFTQRNNESTIFYYEAATTVSDGSGNPLFYSNGTTVYDKTHAIMTNGSGLMGSLEPAGAEGSGAQGVLAINAPGNPNLYYLITTGSVEQCQSWGGTNNGLRYHTIDMTSGANGAVTAKNQIMLDGTPTPVAEQMTAIQANCDTTWVIAHGAANNNFYAFAITSAGVNTTPIVSSVGPALSSSNWNWARGTMDVSPHGDRLAFASGFGVHLFDFNIQTGVVSNALAIATSVPYYGTEFSPDGQKLYYTQYVLGELYQYDICAANINTVDLSPTFYGELVTAPNGKIYATYNGSNAFSGTWLAEIGNPNGNSGTWNFTANKYNSGVGIGPGLPQTYFDAAFYNGGPVTADVVKTLPDTICNDVNPTCLGLSVTPAVAGVWRSEPTGFVNSHGVFNPGAPSATDTTVVKVFFGMEPCVVEDSVSIVVVKCCLPFNTNPPLAPLCPGDDLNLATLVTQGVGTWTIGTNPPASPGKVNATITNPNFITNNNTNPGNYTVIFTLNNALGSCPDTTHETVTVKAGPNLPNIPDTSVCVGGTVTISPGSFTSYTWDDNTTTATHNYSAAGSHYVVLGNNVNCSDTVFFDVNAGAPLSVSLNTPSAICAGDSATLTATVTGIKTSPLIYVWDGNSGSNNSKTYYTGGSHTVVVNDARNCTGSATKVLVYGGKPSVTLPANTEKCFPEGQTFTASVQDTFATIKWNGTLSTDTFHTINSAQSIQVIVSNAVGCADTASTTITNKCISVKWKFPNVFTPNGDGENEHFYPFWVDENTLSKLTKVHFEVYDRWGILMYRNDDVAIPEWKGTFNGSKVSPGVYYWIVRWTDTSNTSGEETGWVEVVY